MKIVNNTEYTTFKDIWNDPNLLTNDEKSNIEFEVSLIGKIIEAREAKGLTQKELANLAGVNQSQIARLETLKSKPQIDTLFKILKPLGYTLDIVQNN